MTILEQNTEAENGKKFRLIVRSAEEAVRVIRDKLGDNAKVISVRQVGGEGLKRFISSPKLEVIAQIVEEPKEDFADAIDVTTSHKGSSPKRDETEDDESKDNSIQPSPKQVTTVESQETNESSKNNFNLLSKFGFDKSLLLDIQTWSNWSELKTAPIPEILKEITIGLSNRYRALNETVCLEKIALIGGPALGKLQHYVNFLAHEVFMDKTTPTYLKLKMVYKS